MEACGDGGKGRGERAETGMGRALNTRLRGLLGPYPVGGGTTFPPNFLPDSWKSGGENIW